MMRSYNSRAATGGMQETLISAQGFKWRVVVAVTAIKLLLVPTYRSTDFEVHRNWLAITHSLPLRQWYTEARSQWTLDYPPLFAWFEWLLAQVARKVDPAMLEVDNLDYASPGTIAFQRGSVIVSDLVLATGALYATRRFGRAKSNVVFFLIVAHPGLLIVDHIHFQYNGFLLGILVWSLGLASEGHDLLSGILFAILVNMKHLYAALGPIYLVYLLRHHCSGEKAQSRFLQLGMGVAAVCAVSFGPFVLEGQLPQILGRLFPFGRGLCHAYWAANVWALYAGLDKALGVSLKLLHIPVHAEAASMTGGLVGVAKFPVLPDIPPVVPLALTLLALIPALRALWRAPTPALFTRAIAYAALTSFMLGYHVHEKAALTAVIPAALGAVRSRRTAGAFLVLSTVSTFALFPLLIRPAEYPVKVLLLVTYVAVAVPLLSAVTAPLAAKAAPSRERGANSQKILLQRSSRNGGSELLTKLERVYFGGLVPLEMYCSWIHPWLLGGRLPFLPLMLVSLYCAVGMAWTWAQLDLVDPKTKSSE